jgi:hypothetical protein
MRVEAPRPFSSISNERRIHTSRPRAAVSFYFSPNSFLADEDGKGRGDRFRFAKAMMMMMMGTNA